MEEVGVGMGEAAEASERRVRWSGRAAEPGTPTLHL